MYWLSKRHVSASGRIQVNPVFALLAGSTYYVVLPCIFVGHFNDLVSGITVYDAYFTAGNAAFVSFFWALVLVALGLGLNVTDPARGRRLVRATTVQAGSAQPARWAFASLCAAFALMLLTALSIRDSLFAGYDEYVLLDDAVWQARGTMSSLYSVMAVLQLALLLRHGKAALAPGMRLSMLLIFVVSSALLLSLGARLYVIMALLSVVALYAQRKGGIRLIRLLTLVVLAFSVFGAIGVLRAGEVGGLTTILLNVATEPMLTSISMFSVITDNAVPLIGKPYLFPADFQAVLPSVLFPGKAMLFDRLSDYGYDFEAPLGGYHVVFSMLINFGVLGSLLAAFVAGLALGRLARRQRDDPGCALWSLCSASLTGMLAFSIFRDPFFISLVKNVLVVSVAVPWLVDRWAFRRQGVRGAGLSSRFSAA